MRQGLIFSFTRILLALLLSLLALAPQAQERSGKRIALVIGNDHYEKVSKLEKAGNDATAMARELKAAGFEVLLHRDLNYRGMVKAVETLANNITGGDQVVVFFAGHGVQIKTGSYLLPVDIEASSESEVEKTAYGLNDLMEKLSDAKAAFTLVMVDACRDNPMKSRGRSVGMARGLLPPDPPKGQMVVYSASKGQQALDSLNDNDKNPNGVFTREFIARMKRPGVRIEDLVREVQESVESLARTVSHEQRPAIYNEARGNFYFFGPTTVQVSPQGSSTPPAVRIQSAEEIEQALWNSIKDEREPAVFDEYLKQYPKGRYAAQAKVLLAKLKADNRAPSAPIAATPAPVVSSEDPETALWTAVGQGNSADDYGVYLKQYPKGKYVALAKQRLQKLKDDAKAQADAADQAAWQAAERAGTEAAYQDYQRMYPNGNYAALVTARLIKAKNSASQREEEGEWQKAEASGGSGALQAYLDRFPGGRHVGEAKARLIQIRKMEAEMRPGKVFADCTDCPEMVVLPAGRFTMGSPSSEADRMTWEGPQHEVGFASPFALGKFEITRGQFARFVSETGYQPFNSCAFYNGTKMDQRVGKDWRNPGYPQDDQHPVVCISWYDANLYAQWLSAKTGQVYRLPSEAEWEYAVRAGSATSRPWGESANDACRYANVADQTLMNEVSWASTWGAWAHRCTDGYAYTSPVGRLQGNAYGVFDLLGNAMEWVEDCWHATYTDAPGDGSAWNGQCVGIERSIRGGSMLDGFTRGIRSASRGMLNPGTPDYNTGFRLVRVIDRDLEAKRRSRDGIASGTPKGKLGIVMQDINPEYSALVGLAGSGIRVAYVLPGSPAEAAGVKAGDVLTHLNANPVARTTEVQATISALAGGAQVQLRLWRKGPSSGSVQEISVRLAN